MPGSGLSVYTHLKYDDAEKEVRELEKKSRKPARGMVLPPEKVKKGWFYL